MLRGRFVPPTKNRLPFVPLYRFIRWDGTLNHTAALPLPFLPFPTRRFLSSLVRGHEGVIVSFNYAVAD